MGFPRPIPGFGRPIPGFGRPLNVADGGGRSAAQAGGAGSLPLSRCATAPPRGERLDRAVRGATPGWQALAPRSARSVRRWLPRVGAAAGGGGGRAAAQAGGAGSLPLSRCATAPPRGERLDRAARGGLQAGRLRLLDRRAPFGGGSSEWELPQAEGEGRAAAQVGAVGSLPLSRCATAPPRGERLDRVVRGATPGWQALAPRPARSVRRWLPRVGAAAGGGRAAAQAGGAGSLPLSRCATAPPRGERLDRVVRGATPGWQALAPRSARSVRRWLPRVGAAAGGGRAAAQLGAVGSLPLSRCATAPPRGERLDRVVRGATPGWQALAPRSARSVRRWLPRAGAAAGGGRAAAQVGAVGSLPLSRCATAPPRGERLDRVVRGATPGWQALAPRSARSVRRWLPRVGAAAGGGRAAAQAGGAGSLPLSRCATAPPRGERLDRVVRGATPGWQALAPRSARSVRRWLPRVGAAAGGGRAAAQVGAVGSLPLSRCATAPPRGERLDRVVREGTAGWQTSARGLARSVRRWLR